MLNHHLASSPHIFTPTAAAVFPVFPDVGDEEMGNQPSVVVDIPVVDVPPDRSQPPLHSNPNPKNGGHTANTGISADPDFVVVGPSVGSTTDSTAEASVASYLKGTHDYFSPKNLKSLCFWTIIQAGIMICLHAASIHLNSDKYTDSLQFSSGFFFALFVFKYRCMIGLGIGSICSYFYWCSFLDVNVGQSFGIAIFLTLSQLLAVGISASIFLYMSKKKSVKIMELPRAATIFILIAIPTLTLIYSIAASATLIVAKVWNIHDFWSRFLQKLLGTATGAFVIAPFVFEWLELFERWKKDGKAVLIKDFERYKKANSTIPRVLELFLLAVASFGVTIALFTIGTKFDAANFQFLIFAIVIWGTTRFRGKVAVTFLFAIKILILVGQMTYGQFKDEQAAGTSYIAHGFIIAVSTVCILTSSHFCLLSKVSKKLENVDEVLRKRNTELTTEVNWRRQMEETLRLTQQKNEFTLALNKKIEKSCQMLLALATSISPTTPPDEVITQVLGELAKRYNRFHCCYMLFDSKLNARIVANTNKAVSAKNVCFSHANKEFRQMLNEHRKAVIVSDVVTATMTHNITRELASLGIYSFVGVSCEHPNGTALLTIQATTTKRWAGEYELTIRLVSDFLNGAVSQSIAWLEKTEAEKSALQQRENAELATKAKSEFLARMSHEIRTPIAGVVGMLDLLQTTELTDEQTEFLGNIRLCSDHLLMVINDVLDLSKIEANKLELEHIQINLLEIMEQSLTLVANKQIKPEVNLLCDIHEDVPISVMGDPTRLRQILVNLIGNAIKFTEKGFVCVEAKIKKYIHCGAACPCHQPGNILIEFAVRDSGMGIAVENQGRLLQAFSQADSTISRQYGGTGLGLAISLQLAQSMGGFHSPPTLQEKRSLWFSSEQGQGSTFYFCMITQKCGVSKMEEVSRGLKEDTMLSSCLVVDKCERACKATARFLHRFGIDVKVVNSEENAANALKHFNPAFVIADCNIQKLWSDPILSQKPTIVVMSQKQILQFANPDRTRIKAISKPIQYSKLPNDIRAISSHNHANSVGSSINSQKTLSFPQKLHGDGNNAILIPQRTPVTDEIQYGQYRVLVVDDNHVNQLILKRQLDTIGVQVIIASNGLEAVEMFEREDVDIIFMDCNMPIMNGLEATQQIRKTTRGQLVPIIALTAGTLQEDIDNALNAGMSGYLSKPIALPKLKETIDENFKPRISGFVEGSGI